MAKMLAANKKRKAVPPWGLLTELLLMFFCPRVGTQEFAGIGYDVNADNSSVMRLLRLFLKRAHYTGQFPTDGFLGYALPIRKEGGGTGMKASRWVGK